MIKTITFDFGGVLYDYHEEKLLEELFTRSTGDLNDFKTLAEGSDLDRQHFRGELEANELLEVLETRIGLKMTEDELAQVYVDSVEPKEEMFNLVLELKDKYNLQLYSDTPKILYERVIAEMPIFDLFSAVTLSFRIGKLKDSPEGHREVIEKAGHSPEEIVFIDDQEDYVKQANKLGINGIKFTNIRELVKELASFGVKLNGKFDV